MTSVYFCSQYRVTSKMQITGGSPALWTRFQECLLHPWGPDGQMTMMLHIYRPRRFQRTWFGVNRAQWLQSSGVCKIPEALVTDSRSPYFSHGHAHVAPMGKWPCRPTSRGWDSSNELDLEWIGPTIAELWAGRTDRQKNGWRPFHSPPFFLPKRRGTKRIMELITWSALEKIQDRRWTPTNPRPP